MLIREGRDRVRKYLDCTSAVLDSLQEGSYYTFGDWVYYLGKDKLGDIYLVCVSNDSRELSFAVKVQ